MFGIQGTEDSEGLEEGFRRAPNLNRFRLSGLLKVSYCNLNCALCKATSTCLSLDGSCKLGFRFLLELLG